MINYSYINSVFPNYENSASYNVKLFNELNGLSNPPDIKRLKGMPNDALSTLKRIPEQYQLNEEITLNKIPPPLFPKQNETKKPTFQDKIIKQGVNDIDEIINNTYIIAPQKQSEPKVQKTTRIPVIESQGKDDDFDDNVNDTRYYSNYVEKPTQYYTPENLNFYNEPILKYNDSNDYKKVPQNPEIKSSSSKYVEDFNSGCNGHVLSCDICKDLYRRNFKENKDYDEKWDILSYILFAIFIIYLLDKL